VKEALIDALTVIRHSVIISMVVNVNERCSAGVLWRSRDNPTRAASR
jgi:hypothetical protein